MNNKNIIGAIAVVALIIAIIGVYTPAGKTVVQQVKNLSGVTSFDEVDTTALKVGGSSGSRVGPVITSTCALIFPGQFGNVAASTTIAADCAVTGVVTGDVVFAQFATTSSNGSGWLITQASASTTSGFITLRFVNNTGTAATMPAAIASTTQYLILHPVSSVPGL